MIASVPHIPVGDLLHASKCKRGIILAKAFRKLNQIGCFKRYIPVLQRVERGVARGVERGVERGGARGVDYGS